jgi:hypothetical protein
MLTVPASEPTAGVKEKGASRFGFWAAILLAVLAATSFGLGITTPPRSGPYCAGICIVYPYTSAVQYVPRDYLWLAPAIMLLPVFVVLAGCIHPRVEACRKHVSLIGLCFASMAAGILSIDYFVQFQVAMPSLLQGETDGLSLFTQYNPHGIFIALEDLGYLLLSAAFLFAGAAFPRASRLERAIQGTMVATALLDFLCFAAMTGHHGARLDYRFEVATITIHWTALLALGVMLAFYFGRGWGREEFLEA